MPTLVVQGQTAQVYTVAEVDTALAGKANVSHVHPIAEVTNLQTTLDDLQAQISAISQISLPIQISNVTGLQAALDGKAATAHAHAQADVTGLVAALAAKVNAAGAAARLWAGTQAEFNTETSGGVDPNTVYVIV